jgi:hypothetical protein
MQSLMLVAFEFFKPKRCTVGRILSKNHFKLKKRIEGL